MGPRWRHSVGYGIFGVGIAAFAVFFVLAWPVSAQGLAWAVPSSLLVAVGLILLQRRRRQPA